MVDEYSVVRVTMMFGVMENDDVTMIVPTTQILKGELNLVFLVDRRALLTDKFV